MMNEVANQQGVAPIVVRGGGHKLVQAPVEVFRRNEPISRPGPLAIRAIFKPGVVDQVWNEPLAKIWIVKGRFAGIPMFVEAVVRMAVLDDTGIPKLHEGMEDILPVEMLHREIEGALV